MGGGGHVLAAWLCSTDFYPVNDILVLGTFPLGPGALEDGHLLAGANSMFQGTSGEEVRLTLSLQGPAVQWELVV